MLRIFKTALLPALCVGALTACSNTGGLTGTSLTTSSIDSQKTAKKPSIDPACVTLVSKIDSLRKDGITDRVAKAGAGKSKTVPVYRTSLARMAELDRANADYQRRCGTLKPATASLSSQITPVAKVTAVKKTAAVKTVKKTVAKVVTTKATAKATATAKAAVAVAPVKTTTTAATAAATDAAKKAAVEAAKKAALEAAKKQAIQAAAAKTPTP